MRDAELSAYVIPSSDPHQSEYPPEHWKARQWISGFEGSAGTVVVTLETAGLWTDARYYLEAEEALDGTPITLFRAGQPEVPQYIEWLAQNLPAGSRVGFDASVMALETARRLQERLSAAGMETAPWKDLFEGLWSPRPPLPNAAAYLVDETTVGESRDQRLERLRGAMRETGADVHLIASLDDIAWTLNIRGSDVPFNPVVLAYLAVEASGAVLFMDPAKLGSSERSALEAAGVTVRGYEELWHYLERLSAECRILLDPARVSVRLVEGVPSGASRVERRNPASDFKARKNETELSNLRACMVADGVAMERFLYWLEKPTGSGESARGADATRTERDVQEKLRHLRSEQPGFVNESFETIAGYGAHGAIVHYRVTPQTNAALEPGGVLLVDSGGQYVRGTTDITRTVMIGEPTDAVRSDFTLVLKAHIALATTRFPIGTTGHQLDAIPRRVMWQRGANYGHGTGHGVGFFLNVHEGPQRISAMPNTVALEPGMVVSNEPGLYRAGSHGIRIENLVDVYEDSETDFGRFLAFETLTLCHIERSLIDTTMLTDEERTWIDSYHGKVWEKLAGELEEPVRSWLREKTRPLD
jgi:Xaa-Pro aminopeptidase